MSAPKPPSWAVLVDGKPIATGLQPYAAADMFQRTATARGAEHIVEIQQVVDEPGQLG